MRHPPERAALFLKSIQDVLDQKGEDPTFKLMHIWARLVYLHNNVLAKSLQATIGDDVYSGPFKGMHLTPEVMIRAFGSLLLGTYEHELHGVVEQIIATPYEHILNIGCGFGYYSVGLALRMPSVHIHGFDTDPGEQNRTRNMSILNKVQDRITIAGLFNGADFAKYRDSKTLVIIDIEGAEMALLDPILYRDLENMDVLVELHDCIDSTISKTIQDRFKASHDIEILYNRPLLFDFNALVGQEQYVDPFDSLIINWENRSGPTPWAFMRTKSK